MEGLSVSEPKPCAKTGTWATQRSTLHVGRLHLTPVEDQSPCLEEQLGNTLRHS